MKAQSEWLGSNEIYAILINYWHFDTQLCQVNKPKSGAVILFDREVVKNFKMDGYDWRKKGSGRYSGTNWKLKVNKIGNIYVKSTHGNEDLNFCRRIFWLPDKNQDHIVLVHYRHISEAGEMHNNQSPSIKLANPGSHGSEFKSSLGGCSETPTNNKSDVSRITDRVSPKVTFFIEDICPEWTFSTVETKVAVIGHFSDSYKDMQSKLYIVFDRTPVAARMVQNGVYCCTAAPHVPGWVDLFLSLDGSVAISKFVSFEYRPLPMLQSSGGSSFQGNDKTIVNRPFKRLCYELFSTLATASNLSNKFQPKSSNENDVTVTVWEQWTEMVKSTADGELSSFLELVLKTMLQEWLSRKVAEGFKATPLDSQGQGVIHLCAILGYAWSVPFFSTARFSLDTGILLAGQHYTGLLITEEWTWFLLW